MLPVSAVGLPDPLRFAYYTRLDAVSAALTASNAALQAIQYGSLVVTGPAL
jgi:hypothetical protein